MPEVLWKEFPEINRKVAFAYNYTVGGAFLGCHCGSISGVSANFGSGYYAANGGRNVEVLDSTKEEPIVYTQMPYSATMGPPKSEINKVLAHLKAIKLTFADIAADGYKEIAAKCKSLPLWVMSDVINYEAPARKPLGSPMLEDAVFEMYGHTADFAKYLIDNKIGYVMSSPIVQNPAHRMKTNYSLNQGWFWIPPNHTERAVDVASSSGDDLFPSKEDWIKKVGADLAIVDDITGDITLRTVFNSGTFPDTKRFKRERARGRNGQFLPEPHIKEA